MIAAVGFEDTWTKLITGMIMGVTLTVDIVEINAGETWHKDVA